MTYCFSIRWRLNIDKCRTEKSRSGRLRQASEGTILEYFWPQEYPRLDGSIGQQMDWQKRIEGTFQIVQLRGLEKYGHAHGRALYDVVRILAIILGLTRRKPDLFLTVGDQGHYRSQANWSTANIIAFANWDGATFARSCLQTALFL